MRPNNNSLPVSIYSIVALIVALAVATTTQAQITNGSFESGLTGWTVSTPGGSTVGTTGGQGRTHLANAAAFNGANQLGSASLAQSFATTPGQRYQLQFDYGVFGANQTQMMNANVMGTGGLLSQTVTGVGPAGTNDTTFTRYKYQFTADSASTSLTFTDMTTVGQSASADGNLDNVSVVAVAPTNLSPGGSGDLGTINFVSGNIALTAAANGPTASQTNTRVGSGCNGPGCATDGNTNGNFIGGNSTTHTANNAAGNQWQVAFGDEPGQPNAGNHEFAIDHITIFNRSDCCQDRLVDFDLDVLNASTGNDALNTFDLGNPNQGNSNNDGVADNGANAAQAHPRYGLRSDEVANTIGDTVRLTQNSATTLSLAEVQVEGQSDLNTLAGDLFSIDIGELGNDFINVEGDANIADGTSITATLLDGFSPDLYDTFDILTAGGTLNVNPDQLNVSGPFEAQVNGNTLQLTFTPEPASIAVWSLLGAGLFAFGYRQRRKRNGAPQPSSLFRSAYPRTGT